jgi:WD40 repeat protein
MNKFDLNKKRFNSELVMNDNNNKTINCMCDLCNGLYIAIGMNELLGCFNYNEKKMLFTFKAHDNQISKIIYNNNYDLLISCDSASYIKFWTFSEQKCMHVFSPECNINTSITDIMFNEINSTLSLITVSYNGLIRIYNISAKEIITTYTIPDKCIKLIDLGTHNDFISLHNDKDILFSLIANNTASYTTHMNINNTNNNFIECFYINNAKDIIILTKNLYYQIWSTCK